MRHLMPIADYIIVKLRTYCCAPTEYNSYWIVQKCETKCKHWKYHFICMGKKSFCVEMIFIAFFIYTWVHTMLWSSSPAEFSLTEFFHSKHAMIASSVMVYDWTDVYRENLGQIFIKSQQWSDYRIIRIYNIQCRCI